MQTQSRCGNLSLYIKACTPHILTPEEVIYAHAIQLGKEGAIKEVLGQRDVAHELYEQTSLLFEALLMEEASAVQVIQAYRTLW